MTEDRARELTHLNRKGQAQMVDVGDRPVTDREASAQGEVRLNQAAFAAIAEGNVPKGEVLQVARLAGIMGAKRTPELIPLCHPLTLTHVAVDVWLGSDPGQA